MPRARNIKPVLFKDYELAQTSLGARYVFIGLWCYCDFQGVMRWEPKDIEQARVEILPYEARVNVASLVDELVSAKVVEYFEHEGTRYLHIVNFRKHQNPHPKEVERGSEWPAPNGNTIEPAPKPAKPAPKKKAEGVKRDLDLWFDSFWKEIEPKKGKIAARKAFEQVAADVDTARAIVKGAKRVGAEYRDAPKEDRRFFKHPSTWLNQGCWMDAPDPPAKPRNGNTPKPPPEWKPPPEQRANVAEEVKKFGALRDGLAQSMAVNDD